MKQKTVATNKAVLYARISSKEQEREGYSIPAQKKLLHSYAQKHGYEIVREFIDVEIAKQSGKTQFSNMVQFLEEHPRVRIILCEKTDRLYRNIKDYVTIDELDVTLIFVKEGSVLNKYSRSHEKFIHGIKVLMVKNYIDNLSEETRGCSITAEMRHVKNIVFLNKGFYINIKVLHLTVIPVALHSAR